MCQYNKGCHEIYHSDVRELLISNQTDKGESNKDQVKKIMNQDNIICALKEKN